MDTVLDKEVCLLLEPEILLEANRTFLIEMECLKDMPTWMKKGYSLPPSLFTTYSRWET